MSDAPTADDVAELRRRLLAHFDQHRRDLPWRGASDPYHVLVSEVMLQQTRVEAVIPYYERWLRRFPTLQALAEAPLDDVLASWQGLGYYRRARNLHSTASAVRERHGGAIPSDLAALRALPGVGEYTAGAVASIAFGVPTHAVDGNVRRVFSRLFDWVAPTPAQLRRAAAALVPAHRPGDFNQALMEFGATVCTPAPRCAACPLRDRCSAFRNGTVRKRPAPRRRRAVPEVSWSCVVLRTAGRVLLSRRPERGLLAGMWEVPGSELATGEDALAGALRTLARLGLRTDASRLTPLPAVRHTFTHLRVTYSPFLLERGRAFQPRRTGDVAWAPLHELHAFALPSAQRRILESASSAPGVTPRTAASGRARATAGAARGRSGRSRSG